MCYFLRKFTSFNAVKSNKCHDRKSIDVGPFTSVKKLSRILSPEIHLTYNNEFSFERKVEETVLNIETIPATRISYELSLQ
jgi:hypothetical protein